MVLALLISTCLSWAEPADLSATKTPTFQICFLRAENLEIRPIGQPDAPKSNVPGRFNLTFDQVHRFHLSRIGSSDSVVCKVFARSGRDEIPQYLSICAIPIRVLDEEWLRIEIANGREAWVRASSITRVAPLVERAL